MTRPSEPSHRISTTTKPMRKGTQSRIGKTPPNTTIPITSAIPIRSYPLSEKIRFPSTVDKRDRRQEKTKPHEHTAFPHPARYAREKPAGKISYFPSHPTPERQDKGLSFPGRSERSKPDLHTDTLLIFFFDSFELEFLLRSCPSPCRPTPLSGVRVASRQDTTSENR